MAEPFDPYLHWLGLRDAERPPNHYRLLGVSPFESDPDVLLSAADRQMAHVRTFQTGKHSAESQKLLNELAAAKVCLLNPAKKAAYDAQLRAAEARKAAMPFAAKPMSSAQPSAKQTAAVPVPQLTGSPEPLAVASTAAPPIGPATSPRRSLILAAAVALLGILIAVIWAITALNRGGETPVGKTADKPPLVATATPKPVAKPKEQPPKQPSPSAATKPKIEPKPAAPSTPASKPKPPVPPPVTPPKVAPKPEPTAEQVASFSHLLEQAREKMGRRNASHARSHLDEAGKATATPEMTAEADRVRAVNDCLDKFWQAVRQGIRAFQRGQKLLVDGRELHVVNPGSKFQLSDGQHYTINSVPVAIAAAIAEPLLPPEKIGACKAAALAFDPSVDRQQARHCCAALSDEDPLALAVWAELNRGSATGNAARALQPFASPSGEEDKRLEVPPADAQAAARQAIREALKKQHAAIDPREQRERAAILRQQAAVTRDDPAVRYVCYIDAMDLALAAGDADLLYDALAALVREYRRDGNALAAGTLKDAAKKPRDAAAQQALARLALGLAENAANSEDFDSARQLIVAGRELAAKASDPGGTKRADLLAKELKGRETLKRRFPEIERTLTRKPDDLDANRDAARYYCLVKNDWRRGLPLVVKSDDAAISGAAQWELAHPSDSATGMLAIGDHWYEAAQTVQKLNRRLVEIRAAYWYRQVERKLTGNDQIRVRWRLEKLGD
jgi:hypothetical protein